MNAAARPLTRLLAGFLVATAISTGAWAYDPMVGDFSRELPTDLRILSYNVQRNLIATGSNDAAFERIFNAINPDIVVLQEVDSSVSATELAARFDSWFPLGNGGTWHVHDGVTSVSIRTSVVSRFPLSMTRVDTEPPSSTRGVTMALVELPGALYPSDLYLMGVHLKCCSGFSEEASRQRSADAMISWMHEARSPGGFIELPVNTPIIALGDFNLVGGPQGMPAEHTLLTGEISDTITFGPGGPPDWDGSNLLDVTPADPFTGNTNTWRSGTTDPTSRLDRFLLTSSVITPAN